MKIAVTGHQCASLKCDRFELIRRFAEHFDTKKPELVIVGMACGTDLLAGRAALEKGYPVLGVIPWAGHKQSKYITECVLCTHLYTTVSAWAVDVVVLNDSIEYPGPSAFYARNHHMVDIADEVAAYWSGRRRTGTGATVHYANLRDKSVENLYGPNG